MKRLALIIFVFMSIFLFGKDGGDSLHWITTNDTIYNPSHWSLKYQTKITSFDIVYRNKFYDSDFQNQLPRTNNINLSSPAFFVGIQSAGALEISGSYFYSGALSIEQMIPISIKLNDTINAKLRGFNVGIPIYGFDALHKYKNIDFLIYSGVNIGRLKVYSKDYINKKNPYFSPKISLMPRVALGKLVLSATAEYDFDIFSKRWKNVLFEKKYSNTLAGFRQSGFSMMFSLGYNF